jgi:hypothetical protein
MEAYQMNESKILALWRKHMAVLAFSRELLEESKKESVEELEGVREWVGLTDEEIADLDVPTLMKLIRSIEAKLKEKNT